MKKLFFPAIAVTLSAVFMPAQAEEQKADFFVHLNSWLGNKWPEMKATRDELVAAKQQPLPMCYRLENHHLSSSKIIRPGYNCISYQAVGSGGHG